MGNEFTEAITGEIQANKRGLRDKIRGKNNNKKVSDLDDRPKLTLFRQGGGFLLALNLLKG